MFQSPGCTCRVLVLTLLSFLHVFVEVETIPTYNAEDYCGFSTSRYETAGILRFNTTTFSDRRGLEQECKVKIAPEQVEGSRGNGKILFYFTEFDLPGTCDDLNVSLVDGRSTKYDPPVSGASSSLCGRNTTLLQSGLVYNTSTPIFTVLLSWAYSAGSWPSGRGFILKFASYYDGPCDDSEDVVKCLNSQCTSKMYHCHTDIDTCRGGEESVCEAAEGPKDFYDYFEEKILPHVEELVIICVVLAAAYYLIRYIRRRYGSVTNFVRTKLCRVESTNRQTYLERSRSSSSICNLEMNQRTDGDVTEPLNGQDSSSASDEPGVIDTDPSPQNQGGPAAPPASHDDDGNTPMAPPPSYDEFMSSEDKYGDKPRL